ncbi:MAG TPA: sugar phosphate nucleotidyltransferase [Actinomycetales bacterium]|nr:sugar phosphate nucleotidyltransferase [Actinomycetales bacterium]
MTSDGGFYAIVPAGGAGTRLWPLSRAEQPKFLLQLLGGHRSLIQATVDRLAPVSEGICVVTGTKHAAAVARQLPALPDDDLFVEPSPRESAAAIGLAAAVLARRHDDAVVGSFAADHVVLDDTVFRRVVAEAVATARAGHLVTVGITPTYPATGFGYVCSGEPLDVPGAPSALRVTEFREKPDEQTARRYVDSGRYRWNAGMFVARAVTLMELYERYQPALAAGLRTIADAWHSSAREEVLGAVWPGLPKIAIDYAIAEPAAAEGRVAVVPGSFGWDDIGDFRSLSALLPPGEDGAQVLGEVDVVTHDAARSVVVSTSGRLVALLGVSDVVVVDTPDALLVADRACAQDVKVLVDRLRGTHPELL